jgi:hypothetical protein
VSHLNVYIGDVAAGPDALDWGAQESRARLPGRKSPYFPPCDGRAYLRAVEKIEQGLLDGRKLDRGIFAAKVTKRQVLDFIGEVYDRDPLYRDPGVAPRHSAWLGELRAAVRGWPGDGCFALIACELWIMTEFRVYEAPAPD